MYSGFSGNTYHFKNRRIFEKITLKKMTVKLNLTINESVARRIKLYANRKQTSVSKIVEKQLEDILNSEKKDDSFRKFIDEYSGSIKRKINYDEAKDEYLKKKYGL